MAKITAKDVFRNILAMFNKKVGIVAGVIGGIVPRGTMFPNMPLDDLLTMKTAFAIMFALFFGFGVGIPQYFWGIWKEVKSKESEYDHNN